jgi:hypothetical protein
MDVDGAIDVRAGSVRRSRVVRAPRCWRYVGGKCPAGNGGKRAVLREEHEVSRKAIAQGRPECSRCPVCSCAFLFCANRTRDRGCSKHPVFPVPSEQEGGKLQANLGRITSRECETVSTVIASAAKQSMFRHKERMDCFAALAMTWKEPSSPVGSFGYESSARCRLAHKSCRVSLPCGAADRTGAFFAAISPPASAITETETTRSTMASTSLRSHCPSDNLVSRSFSRMV